MLKSSVASEKKSVSSSGEGSSLGPKRVSVAAAPRPGDQATGEHLEGEKPELSQTAEQQPSEGETRSENEKTGGEVCVAAREEALRSSQNRISGKKEETLPEETPLPAQDGSSAKLTTGGGDNSAATNQAKDDDEVNPRFKF